MTRNEHKMRAAAQHKPRTLTLGHVLDLLQRSQTVIELSDYADEHAELLRELRAATEFVTQEIDARGSHAMKVILQESDV